MRPAASSAATPSPCSCGPTDESPRSSIAKNAVRYFKARLDDRLGVRSPHWRADQAAGRAHVLELRVGGVCHGDLDRGRWADRVERLEVVARRGAVRGDARADVQRRDPDRRKVRRGRSPRDVRGVDGVEPHPGAELAEQPFLGGVESRLAASRVPRQAHVREVRLAEQRTAAGGVLRREPGRHGVRDVRRDRVARDQEAGIVAHEDDEPPAREALRVDDVPRRRLHEPGREAHDGMRSGRRGDPDVHRERVEGARDRQRRHRVGDGAVVAVARSRRRREGAKHRPRDGHPRRPCPRARPSCCHPTRHRSVTRLRVRSKRRSPRRRRASPYAAAVSARRATARRRSGAQHDDGPPQSCSHRLHLAVRDTRSDPAATSRSRHGPPGSRAAVRTTILPPASFVLDGLTRENREWPSRCRRNASPTRSGPCRRSERRHRGRHV